MKTYSCIIIDGDKIDRLTAVSFIKKFPQFSIRGVFENGIDALQLVEKEPIDVIFLDIDIQGLNGLEFRKKNRNIPVCIYITAHLEHAVESFQLDTLDFIIKPLKLERFQNTVTRIQEYLELKHKAELFESMVGGDIIYIKEGHEQTKIKLHDIIYLEALKDYTKIVTSARKHCVLTNIGSLLKESHFQSFIRVHRSFAIRKNYIEKKLAHEVVLTNGMQIPIGRAYKENLNFNQ
ncbi:MAG: LytTR family DNA-binding domain-containing protein [Flavobacterium sp.]